MKVRRLLVNKEPIKDSAPPIYTKRGQGVLPEYDIRNDKFDSLIEATNIITKGKIAQRDKEGLKPIEGLGERPNQNDKNSA